MTQNTQQRVFSVARQVLAVASAVMGVLTASVSQLHLPPEVSSVLVIAGGAILTVEHYVADPSTGTPITTSTVTTSAPTQKQVVVTTVPEFSNAGMGSTAAPQGTPAGSVPPA